MAWTAQVVDWNATTRTVNLAFTESVTLEVYSNQYQVPLGASSTWLPDLVRDEITRLSARAAATTTIAVGVVTPSAAVTAPATNPTRDQWLADFMKLKRMNVLVTQGVLTSLDLASQLATVKAGYLAAYLDYVNNQT